ncbi:MAG: Holliday junction resolvase RuvX [Candidatus Dormibacteria bacterium]
MDPGRVRVGVAVSDATRTIAQPHSTLIRRGDRAIMEQIMALVVALDVSQIVIGLPLGLDGGEGPAVVEARGFGAAVARATGLPVSFSDERFTTRQAERSLIDQGVSRRRRPEVGDRVAAALLLQGVLAAGTPS